MSHWIHPEAVAELEEAALYLAEHASPALAEALLIEYERVISLLVENQQRAVHPRQTDTVRPFPPGK